MKPKKYILLSMLVAQALILFMVESMIPTPFLPPGAKIGLTNLVTLICLYSFTPGETLLVIFLRTSLSAILVSSLQTFMYSLSGALMSFLGMLLVKKLFKTNVSPVGVSCTGAFFHNLGQILTAGFMLSTPELIYLLPLNSGIGMVTGAFIGFTSILMLKQLKKLKFINTTDF